MSCKKIPSTSILSHQKSRVPFLKGVTKTLLSYWKKMSPHEFQVFFSPTNMDGGGSATFLKRGKKRKKRFGFFFPKSNTKTIYHDDDDGGGFTRKN